ncbi:unnamed protein product [Withania somnifera]
MERSNDFYPLWLEPLLCTEFYGDNGVCEEHCIHEPLCESCWKIAAEAEHEGHQYLKIYKVSKQASVRKAAIEREIDVMEIQPYTINNHKVVLLTSKEGNGGNPNCVICQVKIKDEQYQFCSISCKIERDAEILSLSLSKSDNVEEIEAESSTQNNSLRTKPRKGKPWRSPLF